MAQEGRCMSGSSPYNLFGGEINFTGTRRGGYRRSFGNLVKRKRKHPPFLCITCHISIVGGCEDDLAWILCFEIWTQTAPAPLLWQVPLRDFAVLTRSSRCAWKEINPWWVAEGETRSLVSGSDRALKPGIGSSWTRQEEWRCTVTDSMTSCSYLKANKTPGCLTLTRNVT